MMHTNDSIANTVSFAAIGATMAEFESVLTILLLISGIVLNIMRMRSRKDS